MLKTTPTTADVSSAPSSLFHQSVPPHPNQKGSFSQQTTQQQKRRVPCLLVLFAGVIALFLLFVTTALPSSPRAHNPPHRSAPVGDVDPVNPTTTTATIVNTSLTREDEAQQAELATSSTTKLPPFMALPSSLSPIEDTDNKSTATPIPEPSPTTALAAIDDDTTSDDAALIEEAIDIDEHTPAPSDEGENATAVVDEPSRTGEPTPNDANTSSDMRKMVHPSKRQHRYSSSSIIQHPNCGTDEYWTKRRSTQEAAENREEVNKKNDPSIDEILRALYITVRGSSTHTSPILRPGALKEFWRSPSSPTTTNAEEHRDSKANAQSPPLDTGIDTTPLVVPYLGIPSMQTEGMLRHTMRLVDSLRRPVSESEATSLAQHYLRSDESERAWDGSSDNISSSSPASLPLVDIESIALNINNPDPNSCGPWTPIEVHNLVHQLLKIASRSVVIMVGFGERHDSVASSWNRLVRFRFHQLSMLGPLLLPDPVSDRESFSYRVRSAGRATLSPIHPDTEEFASSSLTTPEPYTTDFDPTYVIFSRTETSQHFRLATEQREFFASQLQNHTIEGRKRSRSSGSPWPSDTQFPLVWPSDEVNASTAAVSVNDRRGKTKGDWLLITAADAWFPRESLQSIAYLMARGDSAPWALAADFNKPRQAPGWMSSKENMLRLRYPLVKRTRPHSLRTNDEATLKRRAREAHELMLRMRREQPFAFRHVLLHPYYSVPSTAPWNTFFATLDVFESLGGFDENFFPGCFEDMDMKKRLKAAQFPNYELDAAGSLFPSRTQENDFANQGRLYPDLGNCWDVHEPERNSSIVALETITMKKRKSNEVQRKRCQRKFETSTATRIRSSPFMMCHPPVSGSVTTSRHCTTQCIADHLMFPLLEAKWDRKGGKGKMRKLVGPYRHGVPGHQHYTALIDPDLRDMLLRTVYSFSYPNSNATTTVVDYLCGCNNKSLEWTTEKKTKWKRALRSSSSAHHKAHPLLIEEAVLRFNQREKL